MSEISYYESRPGKLKCTPDMAFAFLTDMRNFSRFVHEGTVSDWMADNESCSFTVSMVGTVKVRLTEKEPGKRVVYQGDALSKNDFTINVDLTGSSVKPADIKIFLSADLNPLMKMMADRPIRQFMEMMMTEIEKFSEWHDITG
jgi:carbon monoxide dehydrogenase subunit G